MSYKQEIMTFKRNVLVILLKLEDKLANFSGQVWIM